MGFTKFLTNKNQAGGISAGDLFYAWNPEQKSYQQDLLGRWQNRNNGKTGNNTGLIQDETIMQKLAPFVTPVFINVESGPIMTLPTDFVYKLAARINGYKVDQINPSQKWAVIRSVIDPPSRDTNTYYYIPYENYYELLPTDLLIVDNVSVELDYVRQCADVKWAYTTAANGKQVYNPGLSVQPEWKDEDVIEITKRTLKGLGVHFKDKDFEQYGQSTIITGD